MDWGKIYNFEANNIALVPIKFLAKLISGGTPDSNGEMYWSDNTGDGVPWISISDMSSSIEVTETKRKVTQEGIRKARLQVAPAGTVIFAMYASVGATAITSVEATWNQAIIGFQVNKTKLLPKYLFYCLKFLNPYLPVLYRSNTQNNLSAEQVGNLKIPLRPLDEQQTIVNKLDRELAEIDNLIADQQQLLKLDAEHFKSTITSFVHPEPIKDIFNTSHNSVERNGTTWQRTHLGMVTKVNEGLVDPKEEPYSSMTLIAPNHVESGTGKILYTETAIEQGADSGKYLVKKGQVIFSKIRPTLLKSALAPEDCLCSADMYGMSANSDYLTNEFLMWFLLSKPFETFARLNSDRVAMPKLNRETLSSTPIWIPELEFQKTLKFKSNFDIFNLNENQIRESINLLQIKKKSTLQHILTKLL